MAEGVAKKLGGDLFDSYSAGTEEYPEVKPLAVTAMEEIGISMADHYPKLLTDLPNDIDIVITMGCEVECPFVPSKHQEDWGLDDPSGGPIEGFRKTRDLIEEKMKELINRIEKNNL